MKKILSVLLTLAFSLLWTVTVAMAATSVSNFSALQQAVDTALAGVEKTIQLSADITDMTACLDIPANKIITINLNGHSIDRMLSSAVADGYVIRVNTGAVLTVQDSAGGGMITGGYHTGYGGGVNNLGTVNLYAGSITFNQGATYGGGVYNAGTFCMYGGAISYNTLSGSGSKGGGVYNCAGGTFTLACGNLKNGTNGLINQNTADCGGGVYNAGAFTLSGGQISGNAAPHGGGVWNDGTMNVSGNVIIKQNKKSATDETKTNLAVVAGNPIHITGELSATSKIYVAMFSPENGNASTTGAVTGGYGKANTDTSADARFIYDGTGDYVVKRLLGEIRLIDARMSTEEFLCNSLTALTRHVANIELLPEEESSQYDMDDNELLTAADLVLLARELNS